MSRWRKTVDIKRFLTVSDDDEEAQKAAALIAEEIRKEWPRGRGYEDALDIAYDFDGAALTGGVYEVNTALEDLYALADDDRVWLGSGMPRAAEAAERS